MGSTVPPPVLERSVEELLGWFRGAGPTLVALSGGVDSSVVASLAHAALGPDAEAATLVGPSVSDAEVRSAESAARAAGIRHHLVAVDPLSDASYRANPTDRCYRCRSVETAALRAFGAPRGFGRYVDGVHRDDLGDDRPGLRALAEAGFEHPLLWAGWGKARVREAARAAGLPTWDRPSEACLASRVAHGTPISRELLRRIDRAEAELRELGYRRVRVRVGPEGARVEVDPAQVARLTDGATAAGIIDRLGRLGFAEVRLDPRGYRVRANS